MRPQGIKIARIERPVLRIGTGMPRTAALDKNGWWRGERRQKKRTTPRSRRDHAKYKEGSERKVQISKGSTVTR